MAGQPLSAYYLEHPEGWGYAVFPEVGGRGWDVCWHAVDEGYDFMDWEPSLRKALHRAEALTARDLVVAERNRASHG